MHPSRSHLRDMTVWIVTMDMVCLVAGIFLGIVARLGVNELWPYVYLHIEGWIIFCSALVLSNYIAGSYRLPHFYSRFNLIVTWLFAILSALLVLSFTSYAWLFEYSLGRGVLALVIAFYSVFSLLVKILCYRLIFRSRFFICRTVVLGSSKAAGELRDMLENDIVMPRHKIMACMDLPSATTERTRMTKGLVQIQDTADNIEKMIRSLDTNLIVLATDLNRSYKDLYPKLRRLRFSGIEILTALTAAETYRGCTPLDMISQERLLDAYMQSNMPIAKRAKRLFDIVVSVLGLFILCIPAVVVAVLIKLSAPRSPVLYSQIRMGQFGRIFRILKFRTMRVDAENTTGPVWSFEDDPRITPLGYFLRASHLDEIPQLINIVKGEMSWVGPRPERPEFIKQLQQTIPFFAERENVLPGLTGWAQIRYPYGNTIEDSQHKLEYDLYYMKHLSLSFDIQILLATIRIILFGPVRRRG